MDFVMKVVKRLNSLEEAMVLKGKGHRDRDASESEYASSQGNANDDVDRISEDEDEDASDEDRPAKKKKQSVTEKALKGSSSVEQIKRDKAKSGLASIDEDAE